MMLQDPHDLWDRTPESYRRAGRVWYPAAQSWCATVARDTHVSLMKACAVTSILSTHVAWRACQDATKIMLFAYANKQPRPAKLAGYQANVRKAWAVATDRLSIADAFGGRWSPKTHAFYHNLLFPDDAEYLTLDRHMWRALEYPYRVTPERYRDVADAILETLRLFDIHPLTWQAAVWLAQREGAL